MSACDRCLRRAYLLGHLSPRIAGLLRSRRGLRAPGLLALPDDELLEAVGGDASRARAFVEAFDAEASRRRLERHAVEVVCRHAQGYPAALGDLCDPPAALFVKGGLDRLAHLTGEPAVTIVGARRASSYGLEVASSLGRGLSVTGVPVVSGLALGIDAAAHRGVVEAAGAGIAVLASGPDVVYPRAHRSLYEAVLRHGVVLSELPPGQAALRWSFPARNRIMAALGALTLVVEAADPSGSLLTVEFAQAMGRDVGAVPGRVTSSIAAGSNRLLHDGAHVVRGAEDVLDVILGVGERQPGLSPDEARRRVVRARLSAELRSVLEAVESGEPLATLASAAGLGASEVRSALGRLETLGLVVRDALGSYEARASA